MQNLFEPLYKLLKPEKIDTDNLVFRLHYKVNNLCKNTNKCLLSISIPGHFSSLHPVFCDVDQQAVFRSAHRVSEPGHPWQHHQHLLLDTRHLHSQGPGARHGNKHSLLVWVVKLSLLHPSSEAAPHSRGEGAHEVLWPPGLHPSWHQDIRPPGQHQELSRVLPVGQLCPLHPGIN